MSTLYVDTINEKTSGNGVQIPGHVVQVVTATTSTQATTSGLSIVDSGLSASITPKSNTSKVYVMSSFNGGGDQAGYGAVWYVFRDSTQIMMQGGDYTSGGGSSYSGVGLMILDSPATASSVTYKIRMCNQNASGTTRFNTDYGSVSGELATLTLMEIAH